ncbi:unnamed protein product [Orchesella dallaii]|uniref:Uncharacterized protein n=1 Tax=Orchesella dallaii TaxID=48710 RepID=A0ABP1QGU3_9HEXA
MARNIPLYCWIAALISLTFLNHASCAAGNLTRLTCNYSLGAPARAKGVPSKADEVCKQYIDWDYFHTYSKEDCNEGESLSCCEGVCNCCNGPTCTDDTCYALQITGGGSSSDDCGTWNDAPAARGSCMGPARGNGVKNYSEDDCPREYPYLNCCGGECICCRASNVCPVNGISGECESPPKFGGGSGAPKHNGTITV